MGAIPCSSWASTNPPQHQIVTQEFDQLIPNFSASKYGGSGMMVAPSAHPHHSNGLKCIVYVWSGSGQQSMLVWGLIQSTLDIIHTPTVIQEIIQLPRFCTNKKYGGSGMMVDTSAHPQHMNILKLLVHVWSGCGNHSVCVWGLNQSTLDITGASL